MRRHDSLAGHGAYCCGPYSMAVLLERTGTFSQNAPPRRGSLHSASIPLFRFLFVGRPRSLFSSHPTIFRCRLRLFAASYRSIARFFSSAARCLWVSQSRENSLYIYRHPHGTFRLFGRTFLGRVQHYVSARSHVAVKSIQGWHAIESLSLMGS